MTTTQAEAASFIRSYRGRSKFVKQLRRRASSADWMPTPAQTVVLLRIRGQEASASDLEEAARPVDFRPAKFVGFRSLDPTPRLLFELLREQGGWSGVPSELFDELRQRAGGERHLMAWTVDEFTVRLNRLRRHLISWEWRYAPDVFDVDMPMSIEPRVP